MKNILILGAGFMQGVAIKRAKELKLFVIAVDGNPLAPCAKEADYFEVIDLKDTEKLISFAKKFQAEKGLDAVFTTATDFSYAVSSIAKACNLKAHSTIATQKASNKVLMRECFLQNNVSSVPFVSFTQNKDKNIELDEIKEAFKKANLFFPVVVKPSDNMGARGCIKVKNYKDLFPALQDAFSFSKNKTAIVESFIGGKEYSIEGIIINDKLTITALADRHIYFPPYFIEMGHTIPADVSSQEEKKLNDCFEKAVKALGLTYGACKGDIFLHKGKVYIGEIAARLSGGYMSGWTVPLSSKINITDLAIKLSLGETTMVSESLKNKCENYKNNKTKKFCAERAYISIPGIVKRITGENEVKNSKGVKYFFPRAKENDIVVFPKNNVEKCGNVLAVAKSYKLASKRAENAAQKIVLRLQSHNKETEAFLFGKKNIINFFNFTDDEIDILKEKIKAEKLLRKNIKNNKKISLKEIVFPESLKKYLSKKTDVQNRTMVKALKQLYITEKNFYSWINEQYHNNKEVFTLCWIAFLRGGIQGALYVYDSNKA